MRARKFRCLCSTLQKEPLHPAAFDRSVYEAFCKNGLHVIVTEDGRQFTCRGEDVAIFRRRVAEELAREDRLRRSCRVSSTAHGGGFVTS